MKKLLLLSFTTLWCIACSTDSTLTSLEGAHTLHRTVYIDIANNNTDSRLSITPDEQNSIWHVAFEQDDKVGVCSSNLVEYLTLESVQDDSELFVFSGQTAASEARIIYPYDNGALSGSLYTVDISSQNCDLSSPFDALSAIAPMISSQMVSFIESPTSATLQHIGSAITINIAFTAPEDGISYTIDKITLDRIPSTATFDIGADVSSDYLTITKSGIEVAVEESPVISDNHTISIYAAGLPFSLASQESISAELTLTKSSYDGTSQTVVKQLSVTNTADNELSFTQGQYHTINFECSLSEPTTITFDGSELSSYPDSETLVGIDGVWFAIFDVGNYSYYNVPPIQLRSSSGYIYNTSTLDGLSTILISFNDSKKHEVTLYYGTEMNPTLLSLEPTEQNSTWLYTLPEGTTHFSIYNNSTSAAYLTQIDITFTESQDSDYQPDYSEYVALEPYTSSTAPLWAEIPQYVAGDSYSYLTHVAPIDADTVRNFSLCFDSRYRAALWVAYPYHECYNGDASRTNKWAFDPSISSTEQANLDSSYSSGDDGTSYDRGHQISSADRLVSTLMNAQTFYYSNMTPQVSGLNSGQWSSLESKVRAQVCSDTLYIVTGAHYASTLGGVYDDEGNLCPIPSAYYKVLLRTRDGDSGKSVAECSADELQTIGYWVDNIYTGTLPAPMSVSQIEELSGQTFFTTIPQAAKSELDTSLWSGL